MNRAEKRLVVKNFEKYFLGGLQAVTHIYTVQFLRADIWGPSPLISIFVA